MTDQPTTDTPPPPSADAEREATRTDPALLARLVEAARNHKMTPAEVRAQRRSWVRGMTGTTDEKLREILPELFESDELTARAERAEAELVKLRAENVGLRAALTDVLDVCVNIGTFSNGVTDGSGSRDEGDYLAGCAFDRARAALSEQATADDGERLSYQARVMAWLLECFGPSITNDRVERVHRFWEEALELGQAAGCTAAEAHKLVDYVFARPVGELRQEVGGTMVCLAALCAVHDIDMDAEAERELARVWTMVEKIRAKHAAKPKFSPLPGALPVPPSHPGTDGTSARGCG